MNSNKQQLFCNVPRVKALLISNLNENCIPQNIFEMSVDDYEEFLAERRKFMAKLIEKYYKNL